MATRYERFWRSKVSPREWLHNELEHISLPSAVACTYKVPWHLTSIISGFVADAHGCKSIHIVLCRVRLALYTLLQVSQHESRSLYFQVYIGRLLCVIRTSLHSFIPCASISDPCTSLYNIEKYISSPPPYSQLERPPFSPHHRMDSSDTEGVGRAGRVEMGSRPPSSSNINKRSFRNRLFGMVPVNVGPRVRDKPICTTPGELCAGETETETDEPVSSSPLMICKHDDSLIIFSSHGIFQLLESFQRQALSFPQIHYNNS